MIEKWIASGITFSHTLPKKIPKLVLLISITFFTSLTTGKIFQKTILPSSALSLWIPVELSPSLKNNLDAKASFSLQELNCKSTCLEMDGVRLRNFSDAEKTFWIEMEMPDEPTKIKILKYVEQRIFRLGSSETRQFQVKFKSRKNLKKLPSRFIDY